MENIQEQEEREQKGKLFHGDVLGLFKVILFRQQQNQVYSKVDNGVRRYQEVNNGICSNAAGAEFTGEFLIWGR